MWKEKEQIRDTHFSCVDGKINWNERSLIHYSRRGWRHHRKRWPNAHSQRRWTDRISSHWGYDRHNFEHSHLRRIRWIRYDILIEPKPVDVGCDGPFRIVQFNITQRVGRGGLPPTALNVVLPCSSREPFLTTGEDGTGRCKSAGDEIDPGELTRTGRHLCNLKSVNITDFVHQTRRGNSRRHWDQTEHCCLLI